MEFAIQEYAKRLKLNWIRQHYHDVQAASNEEYLLRLLKLEVQQREKESKFTLESSSGAKDT